MFRKFIAGFLVFVFVVFTSLLVFVGGNMAVINSSEAYNNSFKKESREFVLGMLVDTIGTNRFTVLSSEDIKDSVSSALSEEEVANGISEIKRGFENLQPDEKGNVNVKVPLNWLTDKQDEIGENIAEKLFKKLPACTEDSPEVFDLNNLNCVPKGLNETDFRSRLQFVLDREIFSKIPGEISGSFTINKSFSGNPFEFIGSTVSNVVLIGISIAVLLLVVLALVVYRPFVRIIKWEAKSIFLAGLATIGLLVSIISLPTDFFQNYCSVNEVCNLDSSTLTTYTALFGLFLKNPSGILLPYVIGFSILALILWILGIVWDRPKKVIDKFSPKV